MTPYYQDDLVTIYHGDCREWMPEATHKDSDSSEWCMRHEADVIVTDPPYGIGATDRQHARAGGAVMAWDAEYPHAVINAAVVRTPVIAFGAAQTIARELAAFHMSPRVAIWAPRFRLGMAAKDGLAYRYSPVYLWQIASATTVRDVFDEPTEAGNAFNHPSAKPVRLMRSLVALTEGVVLDPFAGSGTTLRAAKDLGRRSIGIEIEERYCEIAAQRCSQEVLGLAV